MDAVPWMFEDPLFRDEPLSHLTSDPEDYLYLHHIYTWNYPEVKEVLGSFTDMIHDLTDDQGVVMLGRVEQVCMNDKLNQFLSEVPREMLPTISLMKYYNCSDFPFNFGFIVDLTILTMVDKLTGLENIK